MRPLILMSFWLLAADAMGQPLAQPVEPRLDREAILQRGISCLHRGVFDSVLIASAALHARDPDDPVGPFLAADAYNTMTRDYRVRRFEDQFDSLITQTITTARKALKRRPTAENYFLLGSAEGYRCFYLFRRGKWLKAINAAMTCLDNLRIALELNPKLVDPLLGLAMYDYGKSKIPGLGRLVRKQNVIAKLERVQREGRYVSIPALYAMQIVHFETGNYVKAMACNDQLYRRFPSNPVCLYNRALLLEKLNRQADAVVVWKQLITRVETFVQPSNGYLAECHSHLSELYRSLGEPDNAGKALASARMCAGRYQAHEEIDGSYTTFEETARAIARATQQEKAWAQRALR